MDQKVFHGIDIGGMLGIQGVKRYGVSIAVANEDSVETFCLGIKTRQRLGNHLPFSDPSSVSSSTAISRK